MIELREKNSNMKRPSITKITCLTAMLFIVIGLIALLWYTVSNIIS